MELNRTDIHNTASVSLVIIPENDLQNQALTPRARGGPIRRLSRDLASWLAGSVRPGFKMINEMSQSNQRLQFFNLPSAFNLMM